MRYQIKGGSLVYVLLLYLTLKESNPAYLSEKTFKCVIRPRKHLINRFLRTYSLIKCAILTSKLQKNICKNRAKKSRYRTLSACCLLSIIVCNTTNVVTSRVNTFKNDAKMNNVTYVKMSGLVRLLLYTNDGNHAFRSKA